MIRGEESLDIKALEDELDGLLKADNEVSKDARAKGIAKLDAALEEAARDLVLNANKRVDGRGLTEIRELSAEVYIPPSGVGLGFVGGFKYNDQQGPSVNGNYEAYVKDFNYSNLTAAGGEEGGNNFGSFNDTFASAPVNLTSTTGTFYDDGPDSSGSAAWSSSIHGFNGNNDDNRLFINASNFNSTTDPADGKDLRIQTDYIWNGSSFDAYVHIFSHCTRAFSEK